MATVYIGKDNDKRRIRISYMSEQASGGYMYIAANLITTLCAGRLTPAASVLVAHSTYTTNIYMSINDWVPYTCCTLSNMT